MRRRWYFFAVGFLSLVGIGLWERLVREEPMNLLVITLDTTRADRIGCYGYMEALTPAIDSVASEGVLFERAYTPAPLTLPSHASLFTGLYPPEHGVITNGRARYSSANKTLADLLSESGYQTAAFVASFVLDARFGLDRGFQFYDDEIRDTSHHDDILHRERNGSAVVNSALVWLERRPPGPFLCWVHLYDPHAPYQLHSEQFSDRFEGRPYDAEVAYLDRQIGKLLRYLKETDQASNTVVVIVGDHGEGLGDHVEENHGYTLYNATQHVPLIIKNPRKGVAGYRHADPVSLVDVLPTICDILGQSTPKDISGQSLAAALEGGRVDPIQCYSATDDPFLQEGWCPQRSLTTQRWKYIRTTQPELYDLEADPGETRNLAASNGDKLLEMEAALAGIERGMHLRPSENVQLSEQERRTLQSLGYLGGGNTESDLSYGLDGPLIDVKDMIQADVDARRAFEMMHTGKIDEAIVSLKATVARTAGHPSSRVFLGEALEFKGDLPAAIASYQQALEIKPDLLDAQVRLGAAYGKTGDLLKAIECFDKALLIHPDSVSARFNLGRALLYQGKFSEAAENIEFAFKMDPDLAGVRLVLSDALVKNGSPEKAIPLLTEELARDPNSLAAKLKLAEVLTADQPQVALQLLEQSLELNPDNADIVFRIGLLYLDQRQSVEAMDYFRKTQQLMPTHPGLPEALKQAQNLSNQ